MLCPLDQSELRPVERQGVEIDYCPRCRGVWLDRGELDKLIDRTVEALGRAPAGGPATGSDERTSRDERDRRGASHPYDRLYGRGDRDERDRDERDRDERDRDDRERRDRDRDDDDEYRRDDDRGRRRRRESWFEDLFDFG